MIIIISLLLYRTATMKKKLNFIFVIFSRTGCQKRLLVIILMQSDNKSRKYHYQKLFQKEENNKIFLYVDSQYLIAKADSCIVSILGSFINIYWYKKSGNMVIQKAENANFVYQSEQSFQYFQNVQFRHAYQCPLLNSKIQLNQQKHYKPCACVMLQHQNKFLITRRGLNLNTFKGAWVLPGGHLQQNQSIIQGGLRQCQQEIGLNRQFAKANLSKGVMAWESVYVKDSKIRSCGLVIFFNAEIYSKFQVKPHQQEVQQFKWKQIQDQDGQHRYTSQDINGYGQAHLNYLSFFRKNNLDFAQQKKWEKNYKSTR